MLTTANASAPKRRGISQCQADRNDMRQAHQRCMCLLGSNKEWKAHWTFCPVYKEGKRIDTRKRKVWEYWGQHSKAPSEIGI